MRFAEIACPLRSLAVWIGSTLGATALFWSCFGTCVAGCVDMPVPDIEPQARIVASWDPRLCGDPHRVAIELEDDDGRMVSRSVPCDTGGTAIDIAHWGVYAGRIYAWTLGPEVHAITRVRLEVDAPVIFWTVDTPR